MQIHFCKACSRVIPPKDVKEAKAVVVGKEAFCMHCRPTDMRIPINKPATPSAAPQPAAKPPGAGSGIKPKAAGSGVKPKADGSGIKPKAAGSGIKPVPQAQPDKPAPPVLAVRKVRRPSASGIPVPERRDRKTAQRISAAERQKKPIAPWKVAAIAGGSTGVFLAAILVVILRNPGSAPLQPDAEAAAPEKTEPEPKKKVATPERPAARKKTASRPQPAPTPQVTALDAFVRLIQFDGMKDNDIDGRVSRIQAFLRKHGQDPVAEEARKLLANLRPQAGDPTPAPVTPTKTVTTKPTPVVTPIPRTPEPKPEPKKPEPITAKTPVAPPPTPAPKVDLTKGFDLFQDVLKETSPLVARKLYAKAREVLERSLKQTKYADAAEWIKLEITDLAAIESMRTEALEALKKMPGKRVSLRRGEGTMNGTVAAKSSSKGLVIKLMSGPEMTITANHLHPDDIAQYLPARNAGRAEDLRLRGVLYLAAGQSSEAKKFFDQARQAGSTAQLECYYKRFEATLQAEKEDAAEIAWKNADKKYRLKKWKDAEAALEAFKKDYAETKAFERRKDDIEKRLKRIELAQVVLRPGLMAVFYKGDKLEEKEFVAAMVWPNVEATSKGRGFKDPAPKTNFSVRLEGYIQVQRGGRYSILTTSDDGIRVWIGKQQLIDVWPCRAPYRTEKEVDIRQGFHPIKVEFMNKSGPYVLGLKWRLHGGFGERVVSKKLFFHDAVKLAKKQREMKK